MKIYLEFTIGFVDDSKEYPWNIQRILHKLKIMLSKYKSNKNIGIDPIYKIDEKNSIFLKVKNIQSEYSDSIKLIVYNLYPKFTEEEMNNAVAYEPYFINRYCFDYDEESNNESNTLCNNCGIVQFKENLEIQPKKIQKNSYTTFTLEYNQNIFFVSSKMYEYLIENGINITNFRPAYTKRKNIIAYRIYSESLLEINDFKDESYSNSIMCSNCGKLYKNLLIEDQYVNKYINKDALENLKDVNLTYEYFGDNRKIIVSKKFYNLIKQKDTKALFLPIYSK